MIHANPRDSRSNEIHTDNLVLQNVNLVRRIAARYRQYAGILAWDDLVSEGLVGLVRAAATYDPARGSISTYAIPWIAGEISRAVKRSRASEPLTGDLVAPDEPTETPKSLRVAIARLHPVEAHIIDRLYGITGDREPICAVADALGISPHRVRTIRETALRRIRRFMDAIE